MGECVSPCGCPRGLALPQAEAGSPEGSGAPGCRSPTSSTPASVPAGQVWEGSGWCTREPEPREILLAAASVFTLVADREKELLLYGLCTFRGFRY